MTSPPPPPPDAVPVCPRHPDRVAYVRCQRCTRPVCPECQRVAAVGVHCVDCVRDAAQVTPQTRTAFGGRVRAGRPLVTLTLIGINLGMYLLQLVVGVDFTGDFVFASWLGRTEPWRFLTSAFLHDQGNVVHIAFNMYALWVLGQILEPVLGRWRFTSAYLVSAFGGSVGVLLIGAPFGVVLGASGAVFGLFGVLLVVLRRLRLDVRGVLVILAINAVLGIMIPAIAWQAHVGGFVTGGCLGIAFAYAPRHRVSEVSVGAVVGMCVVLIGLATLFYSTH
jgi:membrane associated rhomboid family serine protease